jgi:YVTN family beta-propeller protein
MTSRRSVRFVIPPLGALAVLAAAVAVQNPAVASDPAGQGVSVAAAARATVLPTGQVITPAGRTVTVTDGAGLSGPWAVALTPDGRHAMVTSSGQAVRRESVEMFDVGSGARTDLQVYDGAQGESVFYGLAFSPDGRRAWAAGGGQGVVHAYTVSAAGTLSPAGDIKAGHFPTGLAYARTPRGERLFAVDNLGGPGDTGGYEDPPGHTVAVIDPVVGRKLGSIELGTSAFPFGVAVNRAGTRAYVTNWVGRSVSVIDTGSQRVIRTLLLSPRSNPLQADHPTAIVANPRTDELYVADTSSDTVSVIDGRTDRLVATVDVGLNPDAPKGAMPEGLAVSPDGRTLFVSDAGENAVAVVDLARRRVRGFVPTGAYPAGVAISPDGGGLVVVNTNGVGAGPNPCGTLSPLLPGCGTGPIYTPRVFENQYTGTMIRGSVQLVDLPPADRLQARLDRWTAQVRRNNHVDDRPLAAPPALSAIKHVIYVIKENRTYDQVFGSLGKGNGDPTLNIFGDQSAPNHRELARRFTLLDNFYVDAEVSQDGHPWTVQGVAGDYVEKTWPFQYAFAFFRAYSSEFVPISQQFAGEPLAADPAVIRSAAAATAGYLWDDAFDHGVSFRDYGEATPWNDPTNCASPNEFSDLTRLHPRFGQHVSPTYPGWNLGCSDHAKREPAWEKEFRGYERSGQLPGLEIVYLPNDHTQGTSPGEATPRSYVADNDLALGNLVETVSHSRFWPSTLIVTVEDDAQDGADHVDAHRSPSLVISPYTQTGRVDSTHYDTAAALGTIERLLAMAPMSIFDQRATPMWAAFDRTANLRPYTALQPSVVPFGDPGFPVNPPNAPLAAGSAQQDFSVPDGPDEHLLNRAIWESIRGKGVPMPVSPGSEQTDPAGDG